MQRDAVLALNQLHCRRAVPQRKVHLQLFGPFVADQTPHRVFLLRTQRAIFAAAPTSLARRQRSHPFGLVAGDGLAHRREAQPYLGGNLRFRASALVAANHLSPPLVLLRRTQLPRIVVVHPPPTPRNTLRSIYLWAESIGEPVCRKALYSCWQRPLARCLRSWFLSWS
jgi:hypothetical protein